MSESGTLNAKQLRNRAEHTRVRAYYIWEREGRPDGEQLDHWLRAEREMASAIMTQDLEESSEAMRRPVLRNGDRPLERTALRTA